MRGHLNQSKTWITVAAAAATALLLASGAQPVEAAEGDLGAVLAAYPLRSLSGETVTLGELDEPVVVVNFWASWCRPCKKEMPLLEKLHSELSAQGGRVVAVSVDRDESKVRRFLDENHIDLPVYVDGPQGLAKSLDLESLPITFVLDRDCDVVYRCRAVDEAKWAELRLAALRHLGEGRAIGARKGE